MYVVICSICNIYFFSLSFHSAVFGCILLNIFAWLVCPYGLLVVTLGKEPLHCLLIFLCFVISVYFILFEEILLVVVLSDF